MRHSQFQGKSLEAHAIFPSQTSYVDKGAWSRLTALPITEFDFSLI